MSLNESNSVLEAAKEHFMAQYISLLDPKAFVARAIAELDIKIDSRGNVTDSIDSPRKNIESQIHRHYIAAYHRHLGEYKLLGQKKAPSLSKEVLCAALDEVTHETKQKLMADKIASLRCEKEDLSEVERFVSAICKNYTQFDVAKMAHFAWQIKRKMFKLPMSYHLLVHIYGDQGTGKSTAIKHLLEFLQPHVQITSLRTLTDERIIPTLAESYITFIDEMNWTEKESIDALKNLITADVLDYRPMRTNDMVKVRNNTTILTAANKHIHDIINDPTGMRRYCEILSGDYVNIPLAKSIEQFKFFKGVDENREFGYIPEHLDLLKAEQSEMIMPEDIDIFLDETDSRLRSGQGKYVLSTDMYDAYKQWAELGGYRVLDSKWFGRKLRNKGIPTKKMNKDGIVTLYFINEGSSIREAKNVVKFKELA